MIKKCLAVSLWGTACLAQVLQYSSFTEAVKPWDTRAILLNPGANPILTPLALDPGPAGGDLLDIISGVSIPISLTLPSGAEVNAATAGAMGFQYYTYSAFPASAISTSLAVAGNHTVIGLPGSQVPGTYQLKADPGALTAPVVLLVSYYSSSGVVAGLSTDAPTYKIGDTVVIGGTLFDGQTSVQSATITANIVVPVDLSSQVGIGSYQLVSQQSIDANTVDYSYTAVAHVSGGAVQAVGADLTSLSPSLGVVAGSLWFGDMAAAGSATSTNTFTIRAGPSLNLDPAQLRWSPQSPGIPTQTALQDSGPNDYASGDGIYSGTFVPGAPGDYTAVMKATATLPSGAAISRTATTTFTVLPSGSVFGSFQDGGIDDDGNGLIDRVVTTVNLNVLQAGTYLFRLKLQASNGQILAGNSSATLGIGDQQMTISFAASDLYNLGVDGPYQRTSALLYLEDPGGEAIADVKPNAGTTAAYQRSSFDRGSVYFTGQNSVTGVDNTGSGVFDILRVQASVWSTGEHCTWGADIRDESGSQIDSVYTGGTLDTGGNTLTFDFNGAKIAQSGVNGPYIVNAGAQCASGDATAAPLLQTQAFAASQFHNAPSGFTLALSPAFRAAPVTWRMPDAIASVIAAGVFNGQVDLSISGAPAGVTVGIAPSSVFGAGQALVSATVDATAVPGVYPLTITGVSGSLTQSATLMLTVALREIRISVSPSAASLNGGQSQSFSATVSNTQNDAVTWSLSKPVGSITSAGVYTAPAGIDVGQTLQVLATSGADPYYVGKATVTLLSSAPAPTLTSVSPVTGAQGSSVPVTLTGANFVSGAAVSTNNSGVTVGSVTVVSATQITATLNIASSALGEANVTVATAGGTSGPIVFTVDSPPPTLTAATPAIGFQYTAVSVTLTGTNFVSGATVSVDNAGITVGSVNVASATQITATLSIAANAALGAVNFTVTTSGGASSAAVFTVSPSAPTINSISPTSGVQGSSVPITLTGTNFVSGAAVGIGNPGITVSSPTALSATQITATFTIAANAAVGATNVTVTTSGGVSAAAPFTVVSAGEAVSTPAAPTGPVTGASGSLYKFTASGSASSLAHAIQYSFNWGDGTSSGWTPTGVTSSFHTWSTPGTYTITVQARCTIDTAVTSSVSAGLAVTIAGESISVPTTPAGPGSAVTGASYAYSTGGAVSGLGHPVQYQLYWGDGSNSPWLPAGTTSASHTWFGPGPYTVTVKARCATDTQIVSPVSAGFTVSVLADETISAPSPPNGPVTGSSGTSYAYSTGGTASSTGSAVVYLLDWGDGTSSGWLAAGIASASHTWASPGAYPVTAYAADATNLLIQSSASSALPVSIQAP